MRENRLFVLVTKLRVTVLSELRAKAVHGRFYALYQFMIYWCWDFCSIILVSDVGLLMRFGGDQNATCVEGFVLCSGSFYVFGKTVGAASPAQGSAKVKHARFI